jgi:Domain of unknown function (DUF1824)
METTAPLSLGEAQAILRQFNCLNRDFAEAMAEQERLQQALLLVAQHSDYQILGICADSFAPGLAALRAYTHVLGYQLNCPEPASIEGGVYIKFNPKSGICYVDSYIGDHRGVLVSCQSAYESGINEMYGHLPLDLFG